MKVANNIYELIGETPMVKLVNTDENMADIYVKLEWFNPGGSVKDRIAYSMLKKALDEGKIKTGDSIVEATSGNTGIGLAMIASALGLKSVFTMPSSMSVERQKLLKAYGGEIILTDPAKGMNGAILEANRLVEEKGYFMPKQFDNEANPTVHYETTGVEILNQLPHVDAFVAGVGTGGSITGIGRRLKEANSNTLVVAVEPKNSDVLSGGEKGPHMIQGIGAGFIPSVLNTEIYDQVITIEDQEAFEMARKVASEQGLLVGISSGANIAAAIQVAKELGKGKIVVTLSPSNGERYLSTKLYNFE